MRLISTLWPTVRWKPLAIWYVLITIFFGIEFIHAQDTFFSVGRFICLNVVFLMLILMVWNKVLYGHSEGFPILMIWSHVVPDIKVFEEGVALTEMKEWCRLNCKGKWVHCTHGCFSFKNKYDAVGFKLRWI